MFTNKLESAHDWGNFKYGDKSEGFLKSHAVTYT